ncbi:MAG: M48 family metallopeptidase [Crocinitomicaceae bacterium]
MIKYSNHNLQLLFCILLIALGQATAQQDFNNFQILHSTGSIPSDFVTKSSEKVQVDMQKERENLNIREKKIFLEGVHYGVDELLQSGLVIYGDEVSEYITQVAKKLLEKEPELFSQLRFYTIKSNVSNALSTDQGIVFVTTGLISQLTSEAQLAFVLAHEISHYTEKHVVESFEYRTRNNGLRDQIKQLSTYSREKEFEADVLGVKLYAKAGYSQKYVTSTFDVLMYSYLPIDEIEFPETYFNTSLCYIPKTKFPTKKYPIKAEENYDDSRSSHPNIQRRKDKALEAVSNQANWGTVDNYFGNEKFEYIRNLSRFERVRTDILNSEYANALYTIFILEKSFPNSLYLTRMKAQSWLGLATFKQGGSINKAIDSKSNMEGEGAALHYFIRSLNEKEMMTLSMRIVEDARKSYPDDKEISAVWKRITKSLYVSEVQLDQLNKKTFQEAIDQLSKIDTLVSDTTLIVEAKPLSKYDKIRQKKSGISDTEVDSSFYYKYNLSDLVVNELFLNRFDELKKLDQDEKEKEEAYYLLSRAERKKIDFNRDKTDISEFILVEPAAISYKKGKVNLEGSEELEEKFNESFSEIADQLHLKMQQVGKGNLNELGTTGFNDKSIFTSLLIQVSNNDNLEVFPVDFSELDEIQQRYGTNKLVFSIIEHYYRPKFSAGAFFFVFFPPALLGYLPVPFIKGNTTEINLAVLDISDSKITNGAQYTFNEPISKYSLKARIYDIFSSINLKK